MALVLSFIPVIANAQESAKTVAEFQYTGDVQVWTVPQSGTYKFETWGAQGGGDGGALGGYAYGEKYLTAGEVLYVYVGERGSSVASNDYRLVGAGGGATDIRRIGGSWNDSEGLNSRIIVAGGGGGGASDNDFNGRYWGGAGGGLVGGDGQGNWTPGQYGTGGTQDSGGSPVGGTASDKQFGGFGYGGDAQYDCGNPISPQTFNGGGIGQCESGGGGGGWYGGGAPTSGQAGGGGGGGSSYINGLANSGTDQGVRNGNGLARISIISQLPADLTSITVSQRSVNIPVGSGAQLIVTAQYSDGSTKDITNLATYKSSNSYVLTVNSSGYLAGIGRGSTDISVIYKEKVSSGTTKIILARVKGTVY